jgi:hypothetical protein
MVAAIAAVLQLLSAVSDADGDMSMSNTHDAQVMRLSMFCMGVFVVLVSTAGSMLAAACQGQAAGPQQHKAQGGSSAGGAHARESS